LTGAFVPTIPTSYSFETTDRSVYVHCKAGRSRSATVAACYLVKVRPERLVSSVAEERVEREHGAANGVPPATADRAPRATLAGRARLRGALSQYGRRSNDLGAKGRESCAMIKGPVIAGGFHVELNLFGSSPPVHPRRVPGAVKILSLYNVRISEQIPVLTT